MVYISVEPIKPKVMKANNGEPRRRVGFKRSDEIQEEINNNTNVSTVVNSEEKCKKVSMPISPAQGELIETIQSLVDIISDKSFSKYADDQRMNIVVRFMNAVSLNAELNTKTMLLM